MVRIVAEEFLTDERDRKYYADHYTCCPPPLFIIIITLVEVGTYTHTSIAWFTSFTAGEYMRVVRVLLLFPERSWMRA